MFINALGGGASFSDNDAYMKAAIEGGVKVYFTSDFGRYDARLVGVNSLLNIASVTTPYGM